MGCQNGVKGRLLPWVIHTKQALLFYRARQPFSHDHNLVSSLVLHDMRQTLSTRLCARCNAPCNFAIGHPCSYHSNDKLSRHLVGTLTSHWWPLLNIWNIWNTIQHIVNTAVWSAFKNSMNWKFKFELFYFNLNNIMFKPKEIKVWNALHRWWLFINKEDLVYLQLFFILSAPNICSFWAICLKHT